MNACSFEPAADAAAPDMVCGGEGGWEEGAEVVVVVQVVGGPESGVGNIWGMGATPGGY